MTKFIEIETQGYQSMDKICLNTSSILQITEGKNGNAVLCVTGFSYQQIVAKESYESIVKRLVEPETTYKAYDPNEKPNI